MRFYGSLDTLIEYAPPHSKYSAIQDASEKDEEADSLEDLLNEKVRCLSDILCQIDLDIEGRKDLSLNVIYRIYQHYCYLKSKLFELYLWELGRNRGIEARRSQLEKQLDTLKQEKRQEQIKCWQDIALLKKEFRSWFKQYCDLAQRVKIIVGEKVLRNVSQKFSSKRK